MIEGHGDDIYRYDDLVKVNFSSNVYQHSDFSALKRHLMEHFDLLSNYPEPQPRSLEKLIAFKEGISPESVLVTNGATEAIYLIAQLYHGSLTQLPHDRVYWICNPNNPSGNVLMKGFVDYLVRRSPRYTFVVDQSYEGYTLEPLLVAREMNGVPNLLLLHSFSKTYGIPGLRLGYVTGHPNTIQLLRTLRQPWAVNSMAIEAGKYLLKKGKPVIADLKAYLEETERLRKGLRQIEGVRVFETKTNYMLCELEHVTATDLKYYLIHEHG